MVTAQKFRVLFTLLPACLLCVSLVTAQNASNSLPGKIDSSAKYLFYLHGQVVTELGDNAINNAAPEWGPYEYSNILDSLKKRGFFVISEIRKKGTDNSFYTQKICSQADSLLKAGVLAGNIVMVGASSGWDIVLQASASLKNTQVNYVVMGGCWPGTYKDYSNLQLYGRFLSIIESSDPHGTCAKIFENRATLTSYREVVLHTGKSHGFFYKGYDHWINPIAAWLGERK
ncbi:hypothetical protein [Foetidibacter luteolus]|uniref:hypothetical protein n=1 Tax=Foetidibacter luteolus TaxID=2608880 RepID=UPI00129B3A19|nr:hypothetical protein [Foetidibacter luteolus]